MGAFSKLLPTICLCYGLQLVGAVYAIPAQDELFYDFVGCLTFLSAAGWSLYGPAIKAVYWDRFPTASLPAITAFAPRQIIMTAGLVLWSARLGSFLFQRALRHGGDSRFSEIKKSPLRFSISWFLQGTWALVVGMPIYLMNILPPGKHTTFSRLDIAGLALAGTCAIIEVIADRQKTNWRARKDAGKHDQKFISHGLWSLSRHPNYIADIGIWTGMFLASFKTARTAFGYGGVAAAALSPLLTYGLLRYVSGVPPLEKAAKKRFGDDPAYKAYVQRTSVFWPWWKS